MGLNDILEKIASAQTGGPRSPHILPGYYLFEIVKLEQKDGHKGNSYIIELGVVLSRQVEEKYQCNPAGTLAASVINFSGNGQKSAAGNVKKFLLGVLGIDEKNMPGEEWQRKEAIKATVIQSVSPDQPLKGMLVGATTYFTTIQTGPNAGKDFTGVNWIHIPGQNGEMIRQRRGRIDSGFVGTPADMRLPPELSTLQHVAQLQQQSQPQGMMPQGQQFQPQTQTQVVMPQNQPYQHAAQVPQGAAPIPTQQYQGQPPQYQQQYQGQPPQYQPPQLGQLSQYQGQPPAPSLIPGQQTQYQPQVPSLIPR